MKQEVIVRNAVLADAPAIASLIKDYWTLEDIEGFTQERINALLRHFLDNPALGTAWLAEVDGEAAGYALITYVFSFEFGGLAGEIDEFFIRPQLRNAGIGSSLLKAAEQEIVDRGCVYITLQVGMENEPARAFYRKNGYGDRPRYGLMDKVLAPR